jgi:hypothetical protein
MVRHRGKRRPATGHPLNPPAPLIFPWTAKIRPYRFGVRRVHGGPVNRGGRAVHGHVREHAQPRGATSAPAQRPPP